MRLITLCITIITKQINLSESNFSCSYYLVVTRPKFYLLGMIHDRDNLRQDQYRERKMKRKLIVRETVIKVNQT